MWLLYSNLVAIVINFVLAIFLFFFVSNGYKLIDDLYISEEDVVDT